MEVILERFPYRFVIKGELENGQPDCQIEKFHERTKRYQTMYLCDNQIQFHIAISDPDYTRWLDPEGVPCYVRNNMRNPYKREG